jgi:ubiquinone/menaquinone biosynthesis C-methylase UbiE
MDGVTGVVIIPRNKARFLMVRNKKRAWEFPGGRLLKGEGPLVAAKRELKEETGLEGTRWKEIRAPGGLIAYTCTTTGTGNITDREIDSARWFMTPPLSLSFSRNEAFELLSRAGKPDKFKVDYDKASKYFDDVRSKDPLLLNAWTNGLINWGGIMEGSKVLDIGSGTGKYSLAINVKTGAEVIGLDNSLGMLSRAREKSTGCWIEGDALHLPFPENSFDATIQMLVLQHVADEPMAISEAYRVLRPGGKLVIVTPSHGRIRRHIMRHFPGMVSKDLERFLSIPELRWHLRDSGFTCVYSHRLECESQVVSVDDIIDRFKKRYISTLILLTKKEFEDGISIFEKRLRETYGPNVETVVDLTFVEARKP